MLLLFAILGSGVWIALALAVCGFVAILTKVSTPAGQVLATSMWAASEFLGPHRAADVHLDGRNPLPHQIVRGHVRRPGALVAEVCPAGCCT